MNRLELTLGGMAFVLLAAGLLVFFLPEGVWRTLASRRSRWASQASVAGVLFFLGLAGGGGVLVFMAAGDLLSGWQSRRWVPVEATIERSDLVEVRQIRSTNPAYRFDLSYEYEQAGQRYRASQFAFGQDASPNREAMEQERAEQWPVGQTVMAYVHPDDASRAVLKPGFQPKAMIMVVLGFTFLVIGAWQLRNLLADWNGDRLVPAKSPRNTGRDRPRTPSRRRG